MTRRQSMPTDWLIVNGRPEWRAIRAMPMGSGVLLLSPPDPTDARRLRHLARLRELTVIVEGLPAGRPTETSAGSDPREPAVTRPARTLRIGR